MHEVSYQHGDYLADVAAALERWAAWVEGLIAPDEGVAVLR